MLLEFYGQDCHYCLEMEPLVEKLEKETGVKVEKYETWHNEENARKLEEIDRDRCGGVPFFYNTETEEFICGGADYEELKAWAKK
ncbi:MAG: hypothetical protein COX02_01995 [Candidatus Vogelbacteria bacterium CG22_combo_CG10-13_8_21_14_all_37_9]|uniref:Thioredoxin domain-containing protein n=1 Tax=Candidatus Vogelbacteria bacterium CG22_combo_CG10-13_8_21_14_all_37_9 TaxID=1975046 RepID=A0A2H0BKC1_9BACT|nr:MAG: hypothetical protein COX02_01995 [Candidatus Vogelbacteria bacterium CG22_combo_CG10-13_8_21_14_all_37_9]